MAIEFFYVILFVLAFLYSSVGHGGASGYLALMALYGVAPEEMKLTALVLNLFVSLTSFLHYYRHFKKNLFFAVALGSIPLAFIGGTIMPEVNLYKKILGILLLFPIIRFFFFRSPRPEELKPYRMSGSLAIGAVVGLLSGMIGIGGGIILSPLLILLKWADQKQTAAISAAFIFVNSLSGLSGMLTQGITFHTHMWMYVGVAFCGGLAGSYLGSKKLKQDALKYVLATVLVVAAYKLLFTTA